MTVPYSTSSQIDAGSPAQEIAEHPYRSAVDWITHAERRISDLIPEIRDENTVRILARVLEDLSSSKSEIYRTPPSDKRVFSRIREGIATQMVQPDNTAVEVAIHDLSVGGALLECEAPTSIGETVRLLVPGLDQPLGAHVVGCDGAMVHLSFDRLPPDFTLAFLKHLERHFVRS